MECSQNAKLYSSININGKISDDGQFAAIKIGDIVTKPLRLPAIYGQNFKISMPAHQSAQAVIAAPSGNLEAALILGFLWSDNIPPFSEDPKLDGILFEDKMSIEQARSELDLKLISSEVEVLVETESDSVESLSKERFTRNLSDSDIQKLVMAKAKLSSLISSVDSIKQRNNWH